MVRRTIFRTSILLWSAVLVALPLAACSGHVDSPSAADQQSSVVSSTAVSSTAESSGPDLSGTGLPARSDAVSAAPQPIGPVQTGQPTDPAADQQDSDAQVGEPAADDVNGAAVPMGDSGELGGLEPFVMPSLTGMTVGAAKQAVVGADIRYTDTSNAPSGATDDQVVCRQTPEAASDVSDGVVVLAVADSC